MLFLVNVLNIYDRQALGALLEPLRHEFHLSDTQLGALPTVFTVVYALAGLPLGRLADTWSRKRLLAAGVAVWGWLTALGGVAANYAMLFVSRMGVGIGEAVCAPASVSWIGDLVPASRRARAMAGYMTAVPIGVMLSFAVNGPVAQRYGWRTALVLAAVPAVLLIPMLLRLDEPPRGKQIQSRAGYRDLLRIHALWWIAASGAIVNFVLYSFSTFVAAFLTRYHGLSVARAGVWSGLGSGAAGLLGAFAAGALGDRVITGTGTFQKMWGGRPRPGAWRVFLAAASALVAAPLAWTAIALPPGAALALCITLLMAAYGLWQMYYGLVYAAIQDVVPESMRGTAMAGYFLVMYLCGGSLGPLLTGRLSDHFSRLAVSGGAVTEAARAAGLHQAMYVIPVLSVVLASVLLAAGRSINRAG